MDAKKTVYLEEVEKKREGILQNAEKEVLEYFPKKVKELDEILQGDVFAVKKMEEVKNDWSAVCPNLEKSNGPSSDDTDVLPAKRRKTEDSAPTAMSQPVTVQSNKRLTAMIDMLKPILVDIAQRLNVIKSWIMLLVPKIEDGNNFGVSIQEDVLAEIVKAESDAITYLDQLNKYFFTRGKMVSKVLKYPRICDYRRAIDEYDEKLFHNYRLILLEVQNTYLCIHDIIFKNIEKIRQPRNYHTGSLY